MTLNALELSFILDIKKEDARAKMCNAWERENGIEKVGFGVNKVTVKGAKRNKSGKIEDRYPIEMPVEILSRHLNLPELMNAVRDIKDNYLKRSATKKYILYDYPEKFVKKRYDEGKHEPPFHISLPPALASLLPQQIKETIYEEWKKRFPVFTR